MNVEQIKKTLLPSIRRFYIVAMDEKYVSSYETIDMCCRVFEEYIDACETYNLSLIMSLKRRLNNKHSDLIIFGDIDLKKGAQILSVINLFADDFLDQMKKDLERDFDFLTDQQKENIAFHLNEWRDYRPVNN